MRIHRATKVNFKPSLKNKTMAKIGRIAAQITSLKAETVIAAPTRTLAWPDAPVDTQTPRRLLARKCRQRAQAKGDIAALDPFVRT